jgi:prepilin-type processing-associated H-X9-DG protein
VSIAHVQVQAGRWNYGLCADQGWIILPTRANFVFIDGHAPPRDQRRHKATSRSRSKSEPPWARLTTWWPAQCELLGTLPSRSLAASPESLAISMRSG